MDEFVSTLRPRQPVGVRLGLAGGLVILVALAAFLLGREPVGAAACERAEARLAVAWGADRQGRVRAAFAATGLPYQQDAWTGVRRRLDEYAGAWTTAYDDTCRATPRDARAFDLRMDCLERRRAVLAELTELWSRAMDGPALEKAIEAARALPDVAACVDEAALMARPAMPREPVTVELIRDARARLARAHALRFAGRPGEAKHEARAARVDADRSGWAPLRAEAALVEAQLAADEQEPGVEAPANAAFGLATAAHDPRLAAEALLVLAQHLGDVAKDAGRSLLAADLARGFVTAAGDDPRLRQRLLRVRAQAVLEAGRLDEARAAFLAVRELATQAGEEGELEAIAALAGLARVAQRQGDPGEARRRWEQSLEETRRVLGERHPRVAQQLNNVGTLLQAEGDLEGAARLYRASLDLKAQTVGADHPTTAIAQENLATIEGELGRLEEAQRLLEAALASFERAYGPAHPKMTSGMISLAVIARRRGDMPRSLELAERALAILTEARGPGHPELVYPNMMICLVGLADGHVRERLDSCQRGLAIAEQALGMDHFMSRLARTLLAAALVDLGRCREARPLLQVNLAGGDRGRGMFEDVHRADTLVALGRCELADGKAAAAVALLEPATTLLAPTPAAISRGSASWHLGRALWAAGRRAPAAATV
jgi:eukaryotic-like serine/threonine-protein kinase